MKDKENAQFRYRVKNVAEVVSEDGRWDVEWHLGSEIKKLKPEKYSLVVILRQTAKDNVALDFIQKAQASGVKVLFDLDDLIFDYKDLLLLMKSTNSRNIFYWVGYFWGIRRIAKKVDGFLCTNEFLGEKLKQSFKKPYRVVPNSLNRKQLEISEKIITRKKGAKRKDFVVGYFSGSPTHVRDFRMVEPELIKFLKAYDNVRLRVVGHMEFSSAMRKWVEAGRVEFLELVDYLKLQRLMAEVDVNIAPLVINDFTNCKSELKFFEAAVVETTTIASPTYAFEKAITDGKNGFLAQPGEWYDKLEYLYQHPEENRKIALAAKEYALKHYYGTEFLKEVEAAYDYFAK